MVCISNFQSWNSNEQDEVDVKNVGKRNGCDDHLRLIENLTIDIETKNPLVKGYVVYKNIVYGLGE